MVFPVSFAGRVVPCNLSVWGRCGLQLASNIVSNSTSNSLIIDGRGGLLREESIIAVYSKSEYTSMRRFALTNHYYWVQINAFTFHRDIVMSINGWVILTDLQIWLNFRFGLIWFVSIDFQIYLVVCSNWFDVSGSLLFCPTSGTKSILNFSENDDIM